MGSVFKQAYTKPMPKGAKVVRNKKGEQIAEWRDRRGKLKKAPVTTGEDGSERIRCESGTYTARYKNAADVVLDVPTGCKDEGNARQFLAKLEREAELIKAGVMSEAEQSIGKKATAPIGEAIDAYLASLEADGCGETHRANTGRALGRLVRDGGLKTLRDLQREGIEAWLLARQREGMSARNRNAHRNAAVAFGNWCVVSKRLLVNPVAGLPKADEESDPRRKRRALTEDELNQLLRVAKERPLQDALTVRRGKHKGNRTAKVRPEVQANLELLGRERALIYKTLVLTGLRKGELASLTIGQADLAGPSPALSLEAADEKNRQGNSLPIRKDLAADLSSWLAERLAREQEAARKKGGTVPERLNPASPLFTVPRDLRKILDRDLVAAGLAKVVVKDGKRVIDKRDERGRTIDVHALRTTFGTLLSAGGVAPRVAQEAMRHSKIDLTMKTYTDPKLLRVAEALESLPVLPLTRTLTLPLTLTGGSTCHSVASPGTGTKEAENAAVAVNACPVNENGSVSSSDTEPLSRGDWIRTSDLLNPIQAAPTQNPLSDNDLRQGDPVAYTPAYTANVEDLAQAILTAFPIIRGLCPADQARLAALLAGRRP